MSWVSLDGKITSGVRAVSLVNRPGSIALYYRGEDFTLYTKTSSPEDGWVSQWYSFGGAITSEPFVLRTDYYSDIVDIFAVRVDQSCRHLRIAKGHATWETLGSDLLYSPPVAVNWGPDIIDLFCVGEGRALYTQSWRNGGLGSRWSGWERLGGNLSSTPPAVRWSEDQDRIDVFAVGNDSALWQLTKRHTGWGNWTSLGGNVTSTPTVVNSVNGSIEVFSVDNYQQVWHLSMWH